MSGDILPMASEGSPLRRLPALIFLVVTWVALWGDFTVANFVGGTLVALLVLAISADARPRPAGPLRPVHAIRFVGWFTVALVRATLSVALEVVRPVPRITEGIVAVPLRGASDGLVTLVANAISLTPGTLTLEVECDRDVAVFYVHCLHLDDVAAVRRDLERLGNLAVQAFGTDEQRAVGGGLRSAAPLDGESL